MKFVLFVIVLDDCNEYKIQVERFNNSKQNCSRREFRKQLNLLEEVTVASIDRLC